MTARTAEDRRLDLDRRLRAAFLAGAEGESRRRLGRGLTREELERVLRRYPGDVEVVRTSRPTSEDGLG